MRKPRKFNKSIDWLIEEYTVKGRNRAEIAKECGVSEAGLKSILLRYNIKQGTDKKEVTKENLKEAIDKGYTREEIAEMFNYSLSGMSKIFQRYQLYPKVHKPFHQYNTTNDELIQNMYLDGFSTVEVAKVLNTNHSTIKNHLEKMGIARRTLSDAQYAKLNKEKPVDFSNYEKMYDLYITQHLSRKDIAKMYNTECKECHLFKVHKYKKKNNN